jgi:hypothetical protein
MESSSDCGIDLSGRMCVAGLPPAGPKPGEVEVGYGTQPAEKVTGRVTTISEEEIRSSRALTVEDLLRNIKEAGLVVLDGVQSNTAVLSCSPGPFFHGDLRHAWAKWSDHRDDEALISQHSVRRQSSRPFTLREQETMQSRRDPHA